MRRLIRRSLVAIASASLLLGLAGAASASGPPVPSPRPGGVQVIPTKPKPPVARAANVSQIYCAQNGGGYCLNLRNCGNTAGTVVQMWAHDWDNCENLGAYQATGATVCGNNHVNAGCPFAVGSNLNARYNGDWIDQIYAYPPNPANGEFDLATDGQGGGIANYANSNGWNFVRTPGGQMINVYWSNYNYNIDGLYNTPSYMCSPGSEGKQVILWDNAYSSGTCDWNYGY